MRYFWAFSLLFAFIIFPLTGCVSTTPPKGAELVKFTPLELGTKNKWKLVMFGEEKTSNGVFSKTKIDDRVLYFWKDPLSDKSSMYEPEALNWVGVWSHKKNAWLNSAKPSIKRFQFPLWVGKKYRASYQYSERNGWSGHVNTWVTVEKWENLELPVGNLKTLKIVQKNKHFKSIVWLAPELDTVVKFKLKNKKGIRRGELHKFVKP